MTINFKNALGLYIHIPFCEHKCAYCNFASGQFPQLNPDRYLEALLEEMNRCDVLESQRSNIRTVFMGGGTPSYLNARQLHKLTRFLASKLTKVDEWTVEMNPNSVTSEKLKILKEQGVTRISVGVQSFDEGELKFLERVHSKEEAVSALERVEREFPSSWNADFIYGLPDQRVSSWSQTLKKALDLNPQHLSLYELTYEQSTPLGQRLRQGQLSSLPDEIILEMQAVAQEELEKENLFRYEISNYAAAGKECLHNDRIWQGGNFLAYGNGAHGRMTHTRFRNTSSPMDYVDLISRKKSVRVSEEEDQTTSERLLTTLLLGLRRREGVSREVLLNSIGKSATEIWPKLPLELGSLVAIEDEGIRCHGKGWNVLDRLVVELVESSKLEHCHN